MTVRYAMAIDTVRCVGCSACVLACNAENGVPEGHARSWLVQTVKGSFPKLTMEIESKRCSQCANPACVSVCPTGASYIGEGGVVLVDRDKCTGCKACMAACPYGARFVHPEGYVDKCTFCLHRVEKGGQPACVDNCPTGAMVFGDIHDPDSEIARAVESREWHTEDPSTGTLPHLFFLE